MVVFVLGLLGSLGFLWICVLIGEDNEVARSGRTWRDDAIDEIEAAERQSEAFLRAEAESQPSKSNEARRYL